MLKLYLMPTIVLWVHSLKFLSLVLTAIGIQVAEVIYFLQIQMFYMYLYSILAWTLEYLLYLNYTIGK